MIMPDEPDELDSYIESFDDEESSGVTETEAEDSGAEKPAPAAKPSVPNVPRSQNREQAAEHGQEQVQPNRAVGNIRKAGNNLIDERGNIVDERGQILATNGFARRQYEKSQRLEAQNRDLTTQIEELTRRAETAGEVGTLPRRLGLTDDQAREGIKLAASYLRDPLGTIRQIVARTMAQGHSITDILGEGANSNIDMQAVLAAIRENRGQDNVRETETARAQERAEREGRAAYQRFVDENEHAELHGDAIARIVQDQGISPQAAYNRLREFAFQNGFDFSIPLDQQIIAKVQAARGQRPNGQAQQARPMPTRGMTTRDGGGNPPVEDAVQYADPDEDWNTIVRRAMKSIN